jgi:hypothetical protein
VSTKKDVTTHVCVAEQPHDVSAQEHIVGGSAIGEPSRKLLPKLRFGAVTEP